MDLRYDRDYIKQRCKKTTSLQEERKNQETKMNNNTIEQAIANIAATSEALEKYSKDPNCCCSSFAANLLEVLNWELHKKAASLAEINCLYVS